MNNSESVVFSSCLLRFPVNLPPSQTDTSACEVTILLIASPKESIEIKKNMRFKIQNLRFEIQYLNYSVLFVFLFITKTGLPLFPRFVVWVNSISEKK